MGSTGRRGSDAHGDTLAAGTRPDAHDDTYVAEAHAPPPVPKARPTIPSVDIAESLGAGAFGAVYRGHHRALDVDVAVKLVEGNPAALDLALGEARFMARLDHPNLVRIHDAGRVGAAIYLVLELMDGGSLADQHALSGPRLLEIAVQLLAGLQALHEARVIHRDIKPANCLVRTRDGRVKLGDLGIASDRATRAELEMAGTLPFMAPELFEAPPRVGEKSDLYALGMTLACLALPEDPFPRGSVTDLILWAKAGPRPQLSTVRADLPARLANLIDRLLATDPNLRPASATEALAALLAEQSANRAMPVHPEVTDRGHRVGPWVIGDEIYQGQNWSAFAAIHATTGVAARFSRVNPGSQVVRIGHVVLDAAARFSRLDHPGLLPLFDWGVVESLPYMVSAPQHRKLLELAIERPRDELEAIDLVIDLADCVAFLHERDLVYQVVEPNAAYVAHDGRHAQLGWHVYCVPAATPLEADDGTPRRAGIPQFMAPESFSTTGTIDPAVDLWGLGEILYCLCAGGPAYASDVPPHAAQLFPGSLEELRALVASKQRPPAPLRERAPHVTALTERVAMELLDPDPARRPSAATVRDELRSIAARLRGRR